MGWNGLVSFGLGTRPVVGSSESGNKHSGSIQGWEFLQLLHNNFSIRTSLQSVSEWVCYLRSQPYMGPMVMTQCSLIGMHLHFAGTLFPEHWCSVSIECSCLRFTSLGWSKYNLSFSTTRLTEQVNVALNTLHFCSGRPLFESGHEDRPFWPPSRFPSIHTGEFRNNIWIKPRSLPYKVFLVHYLPISLLFNSV